MKAEMMVDGDPRYKCEFSPVRGGIKLHVACCARQTERATVFLAEEDFNRTVVLVRDFNAKCPAEISGDAVAWSYSDGHGKCLLAILLRGKGFSMTIPNTHGHGETRYSCRVEIDGTVVQEEVAKFIKIEASEA